MPPQVTVIGSASWNQIVTLPELPPQRSCTTFADRHLDCLGGTSAGKSLHLAALGVEHRLIAMVGRDAQAALIRGALTRGGTDLTLIDGDGPSERHLNLMGPGGTRVSIFLEHAPQPPTDFPDAATRNAIDASRIVVADLMPLGRACLPAASASPAQLWTDLHDYDGANPYHQDFAQAADVILMNDDALPRPTELMRRLIDRGATAVICTRGAEGALGMAADGTLVEVAAVPVTVVDTNGAGDAFAAGMIAASLGLDSPNGIGRPDALGDAMRAGAAQAALAVASATLGPT